jgi:aminopeptidase N
LWMLRSVVGDAPLKAALQNYRKSGKRDEDAKEFQRVLEATSHKDLGWFFADWVYQDKGLPDLSIVSVSPRELTAKDGRGGFLVAVEVRNDGDAVAEVPVTVRAEGKSGALTATERLRIAGRSSSSTRILFEGTPAEVVVNDGSVPEVGNSVHVRQVVKAAPAK